MNWLTIINDATKYIEKHLNEEIELPSIAKECNVSYHYFSKVFGLVTGYTLKEYIRNRRITLASYEISHTKNRILDIAVKYGYSSNEAFSRAFKKIHGINPSAARKNNVTVFTHFPVIEYNTQARDLVSLKFDVIEGIELNLTGKSMSVYEDDPIATHKMLDQFSDLVSKNIDSSELLHRVHYNLDLDNKRYDYIVGYPNFDDPAYDNVHIKAPKGVRFICKSINKKIIPEVKKIIYTEWDKNDYVTDNICEIEYVVECDDDMVDFYYIVSIK